MLMMMAHKAYGDRTTMTEARIMSSLLKLTLLGSPLAQKRASRILEILRVDKGKQVSEGFSEGGHGCSSVPAALVGGEDEEVGMSEERRAVRQLVSRVYRVLPSGSVLRPGCARSSNWARRTCKEVLTRGALGVALRGRPSDAQVSVRSRGNKHEERDPVREFLQWGARQGAAMAEGWKKELGRSRKEMRKSGVP